MSAMDPVISQRRRHREDTRCVVSMRW